MLASLVKRPVAAANPCCPLYYPAECRAVMENGCLCSGQTAGWQIHSVLWLQIVAILPVIEHQGRLDAD